MARDEDGLRDPSSTNSSGRSDEEEEEEAPPRPRDRPRPPEVKHCRVDIDKTYVEGDGVVFYELRLERLGALAGRLLTGRIVGAGMGSWDQQQEESEGDDDEDSQDEEDLGGGCGAGAGGLSGGGIPPVGHHHPASSAATLTVLRRYRHFRWFHRALKGKARSAKNGRGIGVRMPKIPPRANPLLVDHSSERFLSHRASLLRKYIEELLASEEWAALIFATPQLLSWLTDLPRPFYTRDRACDCPALHRNWTILPTDNIALWGSPATEEGLRREGWEDQDQDRSKHEEELWDAAGGQKGGLLSLPMTVFRSIWSGVRGSDAGGSPSRVVPTDLFGSAPVHAKFSMYHGNVWQLRVDAVGIDAPCGDQQPGDSLLGDLLRASGSTVRLTGEDCRCMIGDVTALSCTHGLNLASKFLFLTGCAFFLAEHESASYSGLHLSYYKILEAAICDHGCRTVAIVSMFGNDKGFPLVRAAHVVLRTVRWFLTHCGDSVDRIILVSATAAEHAALQEAAGFHFPRHGGEAGGWDEWTETNLNSRGDYVCAGRSCRIGAFPADAPFVGAA